MRIPRLTVIIPVYNCSRQLQACLASLSGSFGHEVEFIVVDDQSSDDSPEIARRFGVKLLSSGGRMGPAYARNVGARAATAEVLFFLDADVCVHPGTVERVLCAFENDREMSALIGSYDDAPEAPDFLSQYKNLMHCYFHQTAQTNASTFWSGCGAIRRSVFFELGAFDEQRYRRPTVEDIELGYRLHSAGRKIVLDPSLVVTHLKRWTFRGLVASDIQDRGIPWTELILREGRMPNDLNLQLSQRVSVALVFLLVSFSLALAILWRGYFLTPLFATVLILLARYWVDAAAQRGRWAVAALSVSIAGIAALSSQHHMLGLIPPVVVAYTVLFIRHRYSRPDSKRIRVLLSLAGSYAVLALLSSVIYLPHSWFLFGLLALFLALVILNGQFYVFLAQKRGRVFAIGAIPFHLLYHFYNGIAFTIGLAKHLFYSSVPRSIKAANVK